MPSIKFLLAALIGVATARFSGNLIVRINPDGSCYSASTTVSDTSLPDLGCLGHYACTANGNEIATVHQVCRTQGTRNDSDLYVYPHDTLKFCRTGFCTCMTTQYLFSQVESTGLNAVHFAFNDDNAWGC